jgi:hypothetical protein
LPADFSGGAGIAGRALSRGVHGGMTCEVIDAPHDAPQDRIEPGKSLLGTRSKPIRN